MVQCASRRTAYRDDTPNKRHGVNVIRLNSRVEAERTCRLLPDEEERLVRAANDHVRALVIAALSTGCRLGELLSLQWKQIHFDSSSQARVILLPASKTKTHEARLLPMATRLRAMLEMRRTDPDGESFGPDAYVFGNEAGERITWISGQWRRACAKAGFVDLHFHDLRREFACRLLESRAELHDVRDFLGHANITTTSTYLRSTPLRLARALSLLEGEPRLFPTPFPHQPDPQSEGGSTESLEPLDGEEDEVVTLTFASWNQIAAWLRQLDRLGRFVGGTLQANGFDARAKVECRPSGVTSPREPQAARRRG